MADVPSLTFAAILKAASDITGYPPEEIIGQYRGVHVARARFAVCYVARSRTKLSLSQIGRLVGGRDHTSIKHAISRAAELRNSNPFFRKTVNEISRRV